MIWAILRPHYWILDRKVRTTNRLVVTALIMLLAFAGQWIYNNLIRGSLALLDSEEAVTAIAQSLPLGFFVLLLFAMLGVGDVMHQLYLVADLELLMIAPIPYRTIFIVKLLQCSRSSLVPGVGIGAFLLAWGLAQGAAAGYYLLVVLLVLAAMALTTALVMILVVLLARWLPAQKTRSWMPVVLVLATLGLMLGQQPATRWFLGEAALISFLAGALLQPGQLGLVTAGLVGLAVATSLVAYRVFATSFHEGWNRLREVPRRRVRRSRAARRSPGITRWARPVPQPLRSFLVKEWLALRRSPRSLVNVAQPLVLAVMVLALFLGGGEAAEPLRPLFFWFMLMFLTLFLSLLPMGMPLISIAEEGRKIALLRSAPISMADVLRGKFWATWVPLALSWVLVLVVAGTLLRFPLWQTGFLVGLSVWGLAGGSAMTMAIGGLRVDFTAEDLRQRTPAATGYLMMGLSFCFVLLAAVSFVWLMVRLFPDSQTVVAIQSLAGYGAVNWLFSAELWIPLALVSGQGLFWAGTKVLWDAAVRRLEGWEGS